MAGYGDDNGFTAWLAANGHSLPDTAPEPAILRQRGSDHVDGYEPQFPGVRTGGLDQERAWERTGARAYGQDIPSDLIPPSIIRASYAAAWYEGNNPGSLTAAASAAGAVKRKKLDVLETEYFEGSGDAVKDARLRLSAVEDLLAPFLRPQSVAGPSLWAVG